MVTRGVSQAGKPLDLSNGKWIALFLNAVGEAQIRRTGYLVSVAANGDVACKACGCYYKPTDCNAAEHFKFHLRQLDRFLLKQQEERRLGDTGADSQVPSGHYPTPCTSCGNPIPRTGKPGRPPTECDACKFPLASPQQGEETLTDEELFLEMGLS